MTPIAVGWYQKHIQHAPTGSLVSYVLLGALVCCILLLFWVITRRERGTAIAQPLTPEPVPSPPPPQTEVVPQPPKGVDLHGSIEGLYFLKPAGFPAFASYSVYVKLRITNRGPDEAVITKWYLYIQTGEDKAQGAPVNIHPNLAIKRPDPNTFFALQNFQYESVQPDLTKTPTNDPYRKGIPKVGWVCFDPNDYGAAPPHNGGFFIYIEDSLGNVHWISRTPQTYRMDGELVELPESPPKELSSGS